MNSESVLAVVTVSYSSGSHLDRFLSSLTVATDRPFQVVIADWQTGLVAVLRICFMVMLADLVSATTPTQSMLRAFLPLLSPLRWFGLDPQKIALAFALMIRLISVLSAQYQRQHSAWTARSPRRPSVRLLIPFLSQALRATDHTSEALEARSKR